MKTEQEERLQSIIAELDNIINCLPEGQINAQDEHALAHLETLLDRCNAILHKSQMITAPGLNAGKILLRDPAFVKKMRQIKDLAATLDISELNQSDLSFPFKYAEFLSNQHYALLMSAASPEKELLAKKTLQDYDDAIALIEGVRNRFGMKNFKSLMQLLSKHAIPILHCRIRILTGLYGDLNIKNKEALLAEALELIRFIDDRCVNILKRPPHMSVAIIDRAELQQIARQSTNEKELINCLAKIEAHLETFTMVYREDDTLHDWSTDAFNLLSIAESKGQCLLKLGRLEEAYQAFDSMFICAMNSDNEVRAGWAKLHQAKVLMAAREQHLSSKPEQQDGLDFIHDLLTEAKHKELASVQPTWARREIEENLALIERLLFSHENIFQMDEDVLGNLDLPDVPPNSPSLLPGYNALRAAPEESSLTEELKSDEATPKEKKKVRFEC